MINVLFFRNNKRLDLISLTRNGLTCTDKCFGSLWFHADRSIFAAGSSSSAQMHFGVRRWRSSFTMILSWRISVAFSCAELLCFCILTINMYNSVGPKPCLFSVFCLCLCVCESSYNQAFVGSTWNRCTLVLILFVVQQSRYYIFV